MELKYTEVSDGIRLIRLEGRLDLNGTYGIEVEFVNRCSGDGALVIVDLAEVSYLSSVGIPMLVNTARSVASRGGKMALLNPQENVLKVLELVGVSQHIPIHDNLESAIAGLH